jgi:putative transposase
MSNHVHLVIVPPTKDSLSDFVKCFAQRYAVYRNRKRRSSGKLFEERFYSVPIRSEAQLAITIGYIELNPVRACLVEDPGDHPWSTYLLHVEGHSSKVLPEIWKPSGWYLELSGETETRRQIYKEWVEDCRQRGRKPDHADEIMALERISTVRYTLRLERPDRSRASEQVPHFRTLDEIARLFPDKK